MKKISRRNFLKVSGAVAAAGAVAACGGSSSSTTTAASTSTAAASGEDKFAALGDFTMTVGHAQPEGNPRFVSMEKFAEDVAAATNGHVKVEVYGNGQLGTETPILLPVMQQYGFSPLQFGAMMITGLAIGLVTPPVGMCLNACNKINRMPIIEIFKGAAPYVICNVIVLVSISLWGPLTTALPQLLGYSIF